MFDRVSIYLILVLFILLYGVEGKEKSFKNCKLSNDLKKEIKKYSPIVKRIIDTVVNGHHKGRTWKELSDFVDKFGNRMLGTENLENSIDYMLNRSISKGLENVHGEPVTVPHWVRGKESATLLVPRKQKLNILGLGGSVGTPPEGITAQVLVVRSFDELKKKSKEAKGKIVVFAQKWVNYDVTVEYRNSAASEGAKVGAVATLIRSIAPVSINSPHTGWQDYAEGVTQIPTAALTVEDAMMLLRMYKRDKNMKINLKMEAKTLPPTQSRNSVYEIRGSKSPNKAVIVSGHLDSWDVGDGAMDDGGGAFISWYSLVLLKQLNLRARRTIRAVLWTGEEEGLIGAYQYAKVHDKKSFSLLMESDEGTFTPEGLSFSGKKSAGCIIQEIAKLLAPINATKVISSFEVGSDIMAWEKQGVPMAALLNKNDRYFWYHHTEGDRMDIQDPASLDKCVALWAAVAYVVADLSVELPR